MDIVLGVDQHSLSDYSFDPAQPKDYIDYMIKRQTILRRNANEKQRIYDTLRKKSFDKNQQQKDYEVGQKVLWNINANYVGNKRKLSAKWIGPYEIVSIFNDGQSYTLKVIPLSPSQQNHPMNQHRYPKHISSRNLQQIGQFTVPRSQIKPYFPSFNIRFDGTQSPIRILISTLNNQIHHNPITSNTIPSYHALFHLYDHQMRMGYTPHIHNPILPYPS